MTVYLLPHLLRDSAARHPERTALIFKGDKLSYGELESRSAALAAGLVELGVAPGDRVGTVFDKSFDALVALFAVMRSGACYVPIDPVAPTSRADKIVRNTDMKVLLCSKDRAPKFVAELDPQTTLEHVVVSGETTELSAEGFAVKAFGAVAGDGAALVEPGITDTYPAYILHTSGSTGMPKGVALSHLNALTFVNMAADYWQATADDVFVSHAPFHFDLSVFDFYVAFKVGAAVALLPESYSIFPKKLCEYIDKHGITVWNSVSSVLTLIAERGKMDAYDLGSMRAIIFSGEVLPLKYLRQLKAKMPKAGFFNVYGQTEANSSMCYPVGELPADDGWKTPIGKALPNFEVFAVDGEGNKVSAPGVEGELYVRSSTPALGYWRDPERTAERFVVDPDRPWASTRLYATGDLVKMDAEGNFLFVGRKDHLVKSRGYRIEIGEIELAMNAVDGVQQGVIVTVPDDLIGNRIIAWVELDGSREVEPNDIIAYCRERLPHYMVPEIVEIETPLPKTSTMKIDRKGLQARSIETHGK
ncbi:MAG: amino acid adenylation domain-containing protein [Myxococcales bacterium]|nr:amino acid adenylation domain-containing protein [Myxococcales bacterium]